MVLFLAILLFLAIYSTKFTTNFGIPGLVIFLSIGMIFGSDGFNIIYFDDPVLAQMATVIFLIIILFEGGFNTKKELLKIAFVPAFTLATFGIIVTALAVGFLVHFILNLDLKYAILIGSIIASTDAAAVFAIFKEKNIQPKSSATLEIESASNDPMAIILTTTMIQFIQGNLPNFGYFALNLLWQIIVGIIIGFLVGKIGVHLFNRSKLDNAGFYYVLVLCICLLSFGLAEEIKANGFMAVYISGYYLGNHRFIYKQGITRFLEGTSTFSQVALFLILGFLVFPTKVLDHWVEGIIITLILIFVARPIAVFLSTMFSKYSLKEKIFLCWGGIKGAVPIVLATYPYVAGIDESNFYFNIVFFVVLISALLQGSTLTWLAEKLDLLTEEKISNPYSLELISTEKSPYELMEYVIKNDSKLINKKLKEAKLPKSVLITAIIRENDLITPRGDTVIKENDTLFILTKFDEKSNIINLL